MGCLSCGFQRHSQALEVQVRCVVVLLHPKNNRQSKQTIQGGDTKERKSHIYYIIYIYRYAKWFEAIRQIGELDRLTMSGKKLAAHLHQRHLGCPNSSWIRSNGAQTFDPAVSCSNQSMGSNSRCTMANYSPAWAEPSLLQRLPVHLRRLGQIAL